MKNIVLLIVISLLLPRTSFSQNYINKKRAQVIKMLKKYNPGTPAAKVVFTESDSSVTMAVSGDVQPTSFTYEFDEAGKCRAEKTKASCDSCFNKYLQHAVEQKKYGWQKINENQYVSSYKKHMMIELQSEAPLYTFAILRTNWSKDLYALLINNK